MSFVRLQTVHALGCLTSHTCEHVDRKLGSTETSVSRIQSDLRPVERPPDVTEGRSRMVSSRIVRDFGMFIDQTITPSPHSHALSPEGRLGGRCGARMAIVYPAP